MSYREVESKVRFYENRYRYTRVTADADKQVTQYSTATRTLPTSWATLHGTRAAYTVHGMAVRAHARHA